MVRNIRAFSLLIELENMRLIAETSRLISKPIMGKFLFIYLVFYIYAQIGASWFGGKMTLEVFTEKCDEALPLYWLLNFNDFSAAIITLFSQMIINNWYVTVDMYVQIMPEE